MTAPTEHEAAVLGERRRRGRPERRPGLRLRLPRRLANDAADARGAGGVRRVRGGDRAGQPELPRRDRRQRAEPQPLLAAAVQPRRHRRVGPGLLRSCSQRPTTPSKAAAPDDVRSGAARSRRAASTSRAPAATRSRRRASSASWGEAYAASWPHEAVHGRLRVPPVRDQLERRRRPAADRPRPPGSRRPDQARATARQGVRRHRAGRLRAADPLRRVRDRVDRAAGEGGALRRHGAGDDASRRRAGSGRGLRTGDQARVLPVERRRHPPLPRPRRARPQRLAVGPLLPGRDAEVVARRRPRHDGRDRGRDARQVRGRDQARRRVRAPHPYDLAPVRPRLRLSSTAGAAPGRIDHGVEERTLEARAAGSRSSSAPASRPGATSSPSRSCTPRGPAVVVVRASAEFPVRSPSRR